VTEIDLFDEESEAATERELAWMWLADLDERVTDLEERLEGLLHLPQRSGLPQDTIGCRISDLEALAEAWERLPSRRQAVLW
jgi:hypothetical protein